VVLIDASALGTKIKEGKNQKTLLSRCDEQRIVDTFNAREAVEDFSVVVGYNDITAKNYSLSAGQYFEVKIEYSELTPEEFAKRIEMYQSNLAKMVAESDALQSSIQQSLSRLSINA